MKKLGNMYLIEEFGTLSRIGDGQISVRLFPFGQVVKNGKTVHITPEFARKFTLPHFKPPMKLGSHNDDAPGGGLISALEVKQDGLYATIDVTSKGRNVIDEKHYGYHSPEVIWGNGWLEHPTTGEKIKGPLIVGMALLHTPHLGEAAALYSVEPTTPIDQGDENMNGMDNEDVQVSLSTVERIAKALGFDKKAADNFEAEQPGKEEDKREDFETLAAEANGEVARLTARLADMENSQKFSTRVNHFATELKDESTEIHELLANMEEEAADKVAARFSALYAQMEQNIDENVGGSGAEDDSNTPAAAIDRAVKAKMEKDGTNYVEAFDAFRREQPEIVEAYLKGDK